MRTVSLTGTRTTAYCIAYTLSTSSCVRPLLTNLFSSSLACGCASYSACKIANTLSPMPLISVTIFLPVLFVLPGVECVGRSVRACHPDFHVHLTLHSCGTHCNCIRHATPKKGGGP